MLATLKTSWGEKDEEEKILIRSGMVSTEIIGYDISLKEDI